MKKNLLSLLAALMLCLPALGLAQTRGLFHETDCGSIANPNVDQVFCLQETTINGRTAGHAYVWKGPVTGWEDATSGGTTLTDSASLRTALSDENGTGAALFSGATSAVFVTPVLGTPTSVTLTNATGLPVSTGISGLGTGIATFLATPSSANLASAVTNETGSGLLVFATSPTLTTPVLGVATATSINKLTLTAPATGSTLTLIDGKTFTVNKTLTLDGTDGTTMTFPSTSATIARTDAANTFAGVQTLGAGLVGAPSINFSDSTTGFYRVAADQIGITVGGLKSVVFDGNLNVYNGIGDYLSLSANNTPQVNISAAGSSTDITLRIASKGMGSVQLSNHVETIGTAPAVSNTSANSCGTTAATLVGTDNVGKVTVGATSGTSCTVTFVRTWTNAPACIVNNETTANLARATSTTTTAILAGTFVGGDVLSYHCFGRA